MANRQQRRVERARQGTRTRMTRVKLSDFDILVDGKIERVVFVCANSRGRKVVKDLWPEVEWSTDNGFSAVHPADWLFTHIRITRLPPHLEAQVPLAFANTDSLGFAVACALHCRAWPLRVAWLTGQGSDVRMSAFGKATKKADVDTALYAEYVPPGPYSLEVPRSM